MSADSLAVSALVCGQRPECSIVQQYDAGRTAAGEPLRVFKLHSKPGDDEPGLRDVVCERFEYVAWRGPLDATGHFQSLIVDCNDGYGPAMRGADEAVVRDGVFVHSRRSGAKGLDIDETYEVRLDPWAPLREKQTLTWQPSGRVRSKLWDWDKFSGLVRWTLPVCAARQKQLAAKVAQHGSSLSFAYNPVPLVTGRSAFENDGSPFERDAWKATDLTPCSTRATSDATRGFLVSGTPSTADDASLHVVATSKSIFIQVEDDTFVDGAVADVLTVSIIDDPLTTVPECYTRAPKVRHVAIEVRNGRVASKLPAGMQLDSAQEGHVVRVRLDAKLRTNPALAVSYADSDDGATIERTIATADLRLGDATNIGVVKRTADMQVRCVVQDGKLQPFFDYTPSEPILP